MQNLPIIIYQDKDGIYIAECPMLKWFHTYGKNREELENNIQEAINLYSEMIENKEIELDYGYRFVWMDFYNISNMSKWVVYA